MKVKNILIADDSLLGRISVKKAIEHLDFNILEAKDGYETLLKIDNDKPDLVFLDLLMPKLDGFDVLREMKNRDITIPVIIVSADIQNTTIEKCKELGVFGYLNKPIEKVELDRLLEELNG